MAPDGRSKLALGTTLMITKITAEEKTSEIEITKTIVATAKVSIETITSLHHKISENLRRGWSKSKW